MCVWATLAIDKLPLLLTFDQDIAKWNVEEQKFNIKKAKWRNDFKTKKFASHLSFIIFLQNIFKKFKMKEILTQSGPFIQEI